MQGGKEVVGAGPNALSARCTSMASWHDTLPAFADAFCRAFWGRQTRAGYAVYFLGPTQQKRYLDACEHPEKLPRVSRVLCGEEKEIGGALAGDTEFIGVDKQDVLGGE